MFKTNDLVIIKNENQPLVYRIVNINNQQAELVGYSHRISKQIALDQLLNASAEIINQEDQQSQKYLQRVGKIRQIKNAKVLFGRILHLDGDQGFLENCLSLYHEVGINAQGVYLPEELMADKIEELILEMTPDIVVITGHDTYNGLDAKDLKNYGNSLNFIKALRQIRRHFGYNDIVVIAGACGSHFEALIAAGANFASSPKRINTHTYDPAVTAIKVASTSINRIVNFDDLIRYIENGKDALGGIETHGKSRLLF